MKIFLSTLILLLVIGCEDGLRKSELDNRQAAIEQKERSLMQLEKEIFIREQKLLQRETSMDSAERRHTRRDSLDISADSTGDAAFVSGIWTVRLDCTLSTCENFAVGDTKSETWEITTNRNQVIAQVVSSTPSTKIFTGSLTQNTLYLQENFAPSDSTAVTRNELRLTIGDRKAIIGEREITRPHCRVVYNVSMRKQ